MFNTCVCVHTRKYSIGQAAHFLASSSFLSIALKPHKIVATAERKKQMVNHMLAWFSCDQLLSMAVYNHTEIAANIRHNAIHLIADDIIYRFYKKNSNCKNARLKT